MSKTIEELQEIAKRTTDWTNTANGFYQWCEIRIGSTDDITHIETFHPQRVQEMLALIHDAKKIIQDRVSKRKEWLERLARFEKGEANNGNG